MSTPEQPATPALTRKQLRDIRNTGATPIITGEAPPAEEPTPVEASGVEASPQTPVEVNDSVPHAPADHPAAVEAPEPPVSAPLPRAALPVAVHDLPGADASVDLGVTPLTRRQARQQERIRTASVPVITPEVAAAHAASVAAAAESDADRSVEKTSVEAPSEEMDLAGLFGTGAVDHDEDESPADESASESEVDEQSPANPEDVQSHEHDADAEHADAEHSADETDSAERAVVNPGFGAELLAGEAPQVELPPSFDQLISRSMTGSVGTGNALILSQTPSAPPLVAPVTATGEVLITGTFNLPEGLGSTGHAPGTADGKETDAVLVDGELPAHSSPTPIAASAAISTVKNGGDIIKPPAPEKGGRLMLTLAITAGVLALALVGVLILAFVTGVF
jgi:hypothetical protein